MFVPFVNMLDDSLVNVEPSHLKTSDRCGVSELPPTTKQKIVVAQETAFSIKIPVGKDTWLIVEPFHNMRYGVFTRVWVDWSKKLTPPVTRHKVVEAQAMSFARNPLGQPDVVTNDHAPPSHFVKKVCAGSLKLLVCRPSITDIQNVAETHETSFAVFEFAAGFDGVIDVTVSNSADTE